MGALLVLGEEYLAAVGAVNDIGLLTECGAVFGYLAQEISDYEKELSVTEFCEKAGFSELLPYEILEIYFVS